MAIMRYDPRNHAAGIGITPAMAAIRRAVVILPVSAVLAGALLSAQAVSLQGGTFVSKAFGAPATARTVAALTPQQKAQQAKARQVTAALARFLSSRVSSPSGKLQLRIKPAARADQGYFSEIFIAGRPIQVKKKIRVSEMTLRARNVRISVPALLRADDKELVTLRSITTFRAVVTEDDLTASFARGRSTASMGLRVRFIGDRIRITGDWNWGWFNGPVDSIGKLRLASDHNVYFDIQSLKLNGVEVPAFAKTKFSEKLNPLISIDDLPFSPRFRSLTFKGSQAILLA